MDLRTLNLKFENGRFSPAFVCIVGQKVPILVQKPCICPPRCTIYLFLKHPEFSFIFALFMLVYLYFYLHFTVYSSFFPIKFLFFCHFFHIFHQGLFPPNEIPRSFPSRPKKSKGQTFEYNSPLLSLFLSCFYFPGNCIP